MKGIIIGLVSAGAVLCAGLVAYAATQKGNSQNNTTSNSTMTTRTFELGDFSEIEVSTVKVELTQGPACTAILRAPADEIDKIEVLKKGDEVEIGYKRNFRNVKNCKAVLTVSSNNVHKIKVETAGKVEMPSLSFGGEVDLEAETAGTIKIGRLTCGGAEIDSETAATVEIDEIKNSGLLKADVETAATINIGSGEAGTVDLSAETAGTLKMKAAPAGGSAKAETGGTVRVPTANLRVKADTGGTVKD